MPTREVLTQEIVDKYILSLKDTLCDVSQHASVSSCILLIIRLYEVFLCYCSYKCESNIKGTANYTYIGEYTDPGRYAYLLKARDTLVHDFYKSDSTKQFILVFIDNEVKTRWILTEMGLDSHRLDIIIEFVKNNFDKLSTLKGLL